LFGKNLQEVLFCPFCNQVDIDTALLRWAPPIPDVWHAKKLVVVSENLLLALAGPQVYPLQ